MNLISGLQADCTVFFQICNHPRSVLHRSDQLLNTATTTTILEEVEGEDDDQGNEDTFQDVVVQPEQQHRHYNFLPSLRERVEQMGCDNLLDMSNKCLVLRELLLRLCVEGGHRVLIFCQWTGFLDIIRTTVLVNIDVKCLRFVFLTKTF